MNVVMAISWVVFLLWICFETSAVYEYLMMLPCLDRLSHTQKYTESRKENYDLSYKDYLLVFHNSLFVRLVTCPYCVGVWMSLFVCWVCGCLSWLAAVYIASLLAHRAMIVIMKREQHDK